MRGRTALLASVLMCIIGLAAISPRRVAKLMLGYATNQFEQTTFSIYARRVSCPHDALVLVPMGQSNAGNSIVGMPQTDGDPRIVNFYAGQCYIAAHPLVGNGGIHGSIWPAVAKGLLEGGPWRAVIIAPMAVGGSSVARWASGGDLHGMLTERLEMLSAYPKPLFLWHQGESDRGSDPLRYQTNLRSVIATTAEHFRASRFLVSVASRCGGGQDVQLRYAQEDMPDSLRIFPGPDTDQLGPEYRADTCHFSLAGAERAAALWVASILAAQ